jgi:RelE-like toxin of type II toxin-antitoxin system HigB
MVNFAFVEEAMQVLDEALDFYWLGYFCEHGARANRNPLAANLSGDRRNQCAMKMNGPWRICFRFEAGDAWEVEIVDYH